jgi:hypothetical protein
MSIAAPNHTISPEIASNLAEAADTLFTTDEIIDASAILNELLSHKDRLALITTLNATEARLLQRYTEAHPEMAPDVITRELAARIVTRMWSCPEDEILGGAILLTHVHNGNLNLLDENTRCLIGTASPNDYLHTSALLATGLSAIVSHETGLVNHGDAIREVLS